MAGWGEFAAAMVVFLAAHRVPLRPAIRARLVALMGEGGFLALYSALSVVLLVWLIVAAGRAPYVPLWYFAPWQSHMALALMLAACLLTAGALAGVNPLSFGSRTQGFDPAHPGIAGISRHPVLLALFLWGAAHTLANGDLAHLLLFAPMAAFALLGMALIDRRKRRQWGEAQWREQARATSLVPFAALVDGRWRPRRIAVAPLLAGLALWLALIWLHPWVIGVTPL